jgi:glycine/D-amino acid oxidase-like deaminating enzyme
VAGLLERGSRVAGVRLAGGGEVEADRVVVAAGAWTPVLLPWLADRLRPVGQPVLHFRPADPSPFAAPRFPPWAADVTRTGSYGFPALADGTVKVGHHGPGRVVDPAAVHGGKGAVTAEEEAAARGWLAAELPALAAAPLAASRLCLYCDSFDGDFWIGRDPDREGLVVAAGGSGHGFKFAPVLGGLIADAVEGRDGGPLAARFGWRRLGETRSDVARAGTADR